MAQHKHGRVRPGGVSSGASHRAGQRAASRGAAAEPAGARRREGARNDVLALGGTGRRESGSLDARSLARLSDRVLDDRPSPVEYAIEGTADERGRPALRITTSGSVWLTCQRCLGPVEEQLERQTLLVVASSEAELEAWDRDEHEVTLSRGEPVAATELVEDELLLALPYSPRHSPDDAACVLVA